MDLATFIQKIYDLPNLSQEDYPLLEELSNKYPWFGTAHILQAKCLNNQHKYGFKQSLKKASVYSGNREVLYDLMHDIGFFAKVSKPKFEMKVVELPKPELVVEVPESVWVEEVVSEKVEVVEDPIELASIEESDEITAKKKVETEEIVLNNLVEVEETLTKDEVVEDEPIVMTTETVEVSETEEDIEQDILETGNWKHITVYDPEKELQNLIKSDEDELTETSNPSSEKTKEKHDFLSWLEVINTSTEQEVARQPRKLPMSDESKRLLENFIKNRPSVNRLNRIDQVEKREENVEHSTEFEMVSETLAKLYLKQNLPEKALSTYKKLQLQNPQKFSYFAALIEEVEKLVSQTH